MHNRSRAGRQRLGALPEVHGKPGSCSGELIMPDMRYLFNRWQYGLVLRHHEAIELAVPAEQTPPYCFEGRRNRANLAFVSRLTL